jgi:hypothetical protein
MAEYLITYPNGKTTILTPQKRGRRCSYGCESKFSNAHIGWYKLTIALADLKESGAIVKKITKVEVK